MDLKFFRLANKAGFSYSELENKDIEKKLNEFAKNLVQNTVHLTLENCMAFGITHTSLEEFIYDELGINREKD